MASSGDGDPFMETTRRNFLSRAAVSIVVASLRAGGSERTERSERGDPVVLLWRDWLTAHRLRGENCRRQQKLETELLRQFGSFPARKSHSPKTAVSCGHIPVGRSTVCCQTLIRMKCGGKQGRHWRPAGVNGGRRTSGSDIRGRKRPTKKSQMSKRRWRRNCGARHLNLSPASR